MTDSSGEAGKGRRGWRLWRRRALDSAGGATTGDDALSSRDGLLAAPSERFTDRLPWQGGLTDAPEPAAPGGWRYLTEEEADFLTAAVDRLIPSDPTGPSASEAGVVTFLDRQLAGDYGAGAHFYLEGPWEEGEPTQGYQSRFAPAEFYRHAITAIERAVGEAESGKSFKDLGSDRQDDLLKQMESGDLKLEGPISSKAFFTLFLQNVREGYFSDPIYGGNRDGSAWKMIGFPGAHYDYSEWVTEYDKPVPVQTVGLLGRPGWRRS